MNNKYYQENNQNNNTDPNKDSNQNDDNKFQLPNNDDDNDNVFSIILGKDLDNSGDDDSTGIDQDEEVTLSYDGTDYTTD